MLSRLIWLAILAWLLPCSVIATNASYFNLNSAFALLGTDTPAETFDLPVGTCNAETPCVNGACCAGNGSGLCGYSPAECGAQNCTSNCDAKAECGQYGVPGKQTCPLNVCCSKFGFCGSTSLFCDADEGCQEGFGSCGSVKRPSCSKGGGSTSDRSIGYYESWANTKPCSKVSPEDLSLDGLTHLNFAFVFFNPNTFQIVPMDKNAGSLLSRFTKLKEKKPGLETWVSVGGWSFNDPGPYQDAFSNMASTAENRATFINGLITFMDEYGFDGMDMDWEYPAADDRGGKAEDKANLVLLAQDIYAAFSGTYGFSITLPASYWYLQHFDIAGIQPNVDWFNLMSYDLHGVWDAASKAIGPYVATHTNITEIDLALDLLWRAGLEPEKLVLGQGFYGRSFTLEDPDCNKPNGVCKFSGGAKEGRCSKASGVLTLQEIMDIIKDKSLTPVHDKEAGVKWITWDKDQWVSYDDGETFQQKVDFANSRCLGGMMVWALDQVDPGTTSLLNPDGMTEDEVLEAESIYQDEAAKGLCYTTKCGDKCRDGDHEAAQANGQPGQYSTESRCPKDEYRRICCNKGVTMGTCRWRGYRGLGLSCFGGCADGEVDITQNTNHRTDKEDQSCTGGTQSFCCSGFKAPVSKEQLQEKVEDKAADLALEAAEGLALELAAKAFCRIAIAAATMPLRFIPFVGIFISIALQAAMPALVQVCAKGIAKAGKTAFKFNGKDYDVKLDKPLTTKVDRPASKKPTSASNKPNNCNRTKLGKRVGAAVPAVTKYVDGKMVEKTVTRTCTGDRWPQACYHYKSVIDRTPAQSLLSCAGSKKKGDAPRPQVRQWNREHKNGWSSGWLQQSSLVCQRDEYPPADIWQARDSNVWIRLLLAADNGGAGSALFGGCPEKMEEEESGRKFLSTTTIGCRETAVYEVTRRAVQSVIKIEFTKMGAMPADYGVRDNPCWPKTLVDDPGFALLTNDPWYKANNHDSDGSLRALYKKPPTAAIIGAKVNQYSWGYTPPKKRKADDPDGPDTDTKRDLDSTPKFVVKLDDARAADTNLTPQQVHAEGNPNLNPGDEDGEDVPDPDDIYVLLEEGEVEVEVEVEVGGGNSTAGPAGVRRASDEELREHFGYVRCSDKSCEAEMRELGYASLPVSQATSAVVNTPATGVEARPTGTVAAGKRSAAVTGGVGSSLGDGDSPVVVEEWVETLLTLAADPTVDQLSFITPPPSPDDLELL